MGSRSFSHTPLPPYPNIPKPFSNEESNPLHASLALGVLTTTMLHEALLHNGAGLSLLQLTPDAREYGAGGAKASPQVQVYYPSGDADRFTSCNCNPRAIRSMHASSHESQSPTNPNARRGKDPMSSPLTRSPGVALSLYRIPYVMLASSSRARARAHARCSYSRSVPTRPSARQMRWRSGCHDIPSITPQDYQPQIR